MLSPRVKFIYDSVNITNFKIYNLHNHVLFFEKVFYILFLCLFSYMMLCEFTYQDFDFKYIANQNSTNISFIRERNETLDEYIKDKSINKPNIIQYLMIFWVFSFCCEEVRQVTPTFLMKYKLLIEKSVFFFEHFFPLTYIKA